MMLYISKIGSLYLPSDAPRYFTYTILLKDNHNYYGSLMYASNGRLMYDAIH